MPFDIHTYGDQLVSKFSQLNQWCPFAELVAGQPAFEVCRSMLASLQLVSSPGAWEGSGACALPTPCPSRPTTTRWTSASSQGSRRLWTPCPCDYSRTSGPTRASRPTLPPPWPSPELGDAHICPLHPRFLAGPA